MDAFQTLYKKLNKGQKDAVDAVEGPVMVVAGPGTGKTHILTLRIANILQKTDTPPDGILALTFTEAAAANMRKRLADIIGSAGYRVRIHTFHGFCQDVIERYPDEFPRIIGSEPVSDIEKIDILTKIIIDNNWVHLKPFGNNLYYLQPMRSAISQLKRENTSPDQLSEFLAHQKSAFNAIPDLIYDKGQYSGTMKGKYQAEAKKIERTQEFLEVYREYESELRRRHRYDFEDMIMEVVSALQRDRNLLLRLQEEFLYILADEHQDANTAQNALLELLASFHENPNLFVVGDEKQAIFRFQGASLENFLYFKKRFPGAALVQLTESYRSGQEILDAAHSLAAARERVGDDAGPVPLISRVFEKEMRLPAGRQGIELHTFSTGQLERAWLAGEVERLIKEGVEPSEIAVLYRTNGEASDIATAIEEKGMHVSIESDQNALADTEIRRFLTLLQAVARFGDDEALNAALHLNFLKVSPLDAYKIAHYARRNDCFIADVMRSEKLLKDTGVDNARAVRALYRELETLAQSDGSVPYIVERLLQESGFLEYVMRSRHVVELLEKIGGLMRDVAVLASGNPDYTLKDLVDHIGVLEENRIPVSKENRPIARRGAVRLMTAHRSKGLEFEYVCIVNVADGVWGGRSERSLFAMPQGAASGSDEDERRLLYVALTRAKIGIHVSFAQESKSGSERLRSRLLEDIKPELMSTVSTEEFESKNAGRLLGTGGKKRIVPPAPDAVYLRELFEEQGLSVTALNNYLACPWQYFYSSLLRVPISPTKEMIFGTAAHRVLKRFFDDRGRGKRVKKEQLVKWFEEAVTQVPLSRSERDEVRERGIKFLGGWYDTYEKVWPKGSRSEYKITVEFPISVGAGKLRLRGDLDKLEMEEGSTAVTVVDYKTGQPKSRNAILGQTKDESGPAYYRQLVFYKLLLELEGRYTMQAAELDFLQPDPKGRFHKERFDISKPEVEGLKEEINRVASEIWNLSYWDSRCERSDCQYCALRELMK